MCVSPGIDVSRSAPGMPLYMSIYGYIGVYPSVYRYVSGQYNAISVSRYAYMYIPLYLSKQLSMQLSMYISM